MPRVSPSTTRSLAALALLTLVMGASGCNASAAEPPPRPEEVTLEVTSVPVVEVETPAYLRLTGTLRGSREANVAADVSGRVISVAVDRGDQVKAGQVLARVDVKAARLSLAEATVNVEASRTQVEIDQRECERYEQLHRGGAVSEQEYDQVTARCKASPLQLEAARARQNMVAKSVGDGVIRAPFAGVVTERMVEVGEYVQVPTAVVSLSQDSELRLVFSVPERNIPQVKLGAPVTLRVPAHGESPFVGRVSHLSGTVRATRDMLAEAVVDNADKKLVPGMFADVEVQTGTQTLPAVPTTAVFEQNGKLNVFIEHEDRLFQRVIHPLPGVDDLVPVGAGVKVGEHVVSPVSHEMKNGQRVK